MTPEEIAADRAVIDAATDGPWVADGSDPVWITGGARGYDDVLVPEEVSCASYCYGGSSRYGLDPCDAEFIAAARTGWPRALDALEAAWAEVERAPAPMFESAYWRVQAVLDGALGENDEDGTGEGIADDVRLLVAQRDKARAEVERLRDASERIGAMVEWLAEVIVDAREACDRTESIQPQGSPDWVESGIAMRKTVLHEVRKVLNRERTAHPSALDRVTAERDEAIRHKVEMDDLRRQAKAERDEARVAIDRVRALCDDAEIAVDQGRAQGHVCGPDCHCDCLAVEDVRAAADTTRPLDGEGDDQ